TISTLDERSEFLDFRYQVKDVLLYAYYLLHSDCLFVLGNLLEKALSLGDKHQIEGILFGFCSLSESVPPEESQYIPNVFASLPRLPPSGDFPQLTKTTLDLIGQYSEW